MLSKRIPYYQLGYDNLCHHYRRVHTHNIRCYPTALSLSRFDYNHVNIGFGHDNTNRMKQKFNDWKTIQQTFHLSSSSLSSKTSICMSNLEDQSTTSTVMISRNDNPILNDLNPNQIAAVTQPLEGITRVVAGPGSGKTRVLISRIAWLLQEDRRNRILAVTFTKKAANEMQHRLESLLVKQHEHDANDMNEQQKCDAKDIDRVSLGTFHSICTTILRWNGDLLCQLPSVVQVMSRSQNPTVLDRSFTIIDQDEQIRILKETLKELKIDLSKDKVRPLYLLNELSKFRNDVIMSRLNPFGTSGDMIKELELSRQDVMADILRRVYFLYRVKLLSSNCIDFDDIIFYTRELLSMNSNICDQIQKRWKHVLIDEYQDTSASQMDLIKLITNRSLLVVGDADQSIYSWRGAHAGSMYNFDKDFFQFGRIKTIYLMENYRSTSNIVTAAQKVIADSGNSSSNRKKMLPQRTNGSPPRIIECLDAKDEAAYVVREVKEKLIAGELGPEDTVAFIYRTNLQSRLLQEACGIHKIAFRLFGSETSFYKRQEIRDCLCYLRWLYNGRDRTSMLRAIRTPRKNIGDVAIGEFIQYCQVIDSHCEEHAPQLAKPTPLDVLLFIAGDYNWCNVKDGFFPPPSETISTRSLAPIKAFSSQMHKIRSFASTATVEQLISYIIDEMQLINHFDNISKTIREFHDHEANVKELRIAAERYDRDGPCLVDSQQQNVDRQQVGSFDNNPLSPLGKFLDDVTLVSDSVDEDSNCGKFVVNLMTIHGSKGMEFDSVYLVGMEDGTIPTLQALNDTDPVSLEEEKRLCYVAMTRAKSELVMTWRRHVPSFTKSGIKTFVRNRSRFLDILTNETLTSSTQSLYTFQAQETYSAELINNELSNADKTTSYSDENWWKEIISRTWRFVVRSWLACNFTKHDKYNNASRHDTSTEKTTTNISPRMK